MTRDGRQVGSWRSVCSPCCSLRVLWMRATGTRGRCPNRVVPRRRVFSSNGIGMTTDRIVMTSRPTARALGRQLTAGFLRAAMIRPVMTAVGIRIGGIGGPAMGPGVFRVRCAMTLPVIRRPHLGARRIPVGGFTAPWVFTGSRTRLIRRPGRRMVDSRVVFPGRIHCTPAPAWDFRAWDRLGMGRPRVDTRYTAYPTRGVVWKRFWQCRALAGSPLGRRAIPKRAKLHWRST